MTTTGRSFILCPNTNAHFVRVDRARSPNLRECEFYAGRSAAQAALRALGISVSDIPVAPSGAPVWPSGVCGSIAHSKFLACAVTGHKREFQSFGVDLEPLESEAQTSQLRSYYLSANENRALSPREALIAFSAKEALFKLLYPLTEEYFGFLGAEVQRIEPHFLALQLTARVGEFNRGRTFRINVATAHDHVITLGAI